MTGTLAQLIALVAYGNQCISHPGTHREFVQQHSTFRFCEKVFFTAEMTTGMLPFAAFVRMGRTQRKTPDIFMEFAKLIFPEEQE
jgi:hypothetical protein